jgi:lipid A 3-O-deacylase
MMRQSAKGRLRVLLALVMVGAPWAMVSAAGEPKTPEERNLWRLEWDNDGFFHHDNAFTNGGSIQRHSHQYDSWQEMGPSKFSGWISRTIPGLGDGGGRVVKRGTGLSQIITTPEDISNPDPQPGDMPWAGTLGWSESWYAFDNRSLNAFQIYAGILGPYSLAEPVQTQVHDWINADEPLGWDNQLKTEPLLNLNYAYKRKLLSAGTYMRRFAGDLAVGGQAALGNLFTQADVSLEARFGWGMPEGFVHTADPPGNGIMLNPNKGVPGKFQIYFSVVARVTVVAYTVFYDGNTFRESPHPGLDYDTVTPSVVLGLHVASGRFSTHFNFYTYETLPFESSNPSTDLTWANITLEYRF